MVAYLFLLPAMQVEWAKTKARADRWDEEFILTVEEMRRVLAFFKWKAHLWTIRANQRSDVSVALRSGLCAYAYKQAACYNSLAQSFACKWYPLMVNNSIPIEWPPEYIPL